MRCREFKRNNYIEFISTGQYRFSPGYRSFNFPWYLPACPPSIGLEINLFFNQPRRAPGVASLRCLPLAFFWTPRNQFRLKKSLRAIIGTTRKRFENGFDNFRFNVSTPAGLVLSLCASSSLPFLLLPSTWTLREGQVVLKHSVLHHEINLNPAHWRIARGFGRRRTRQRAG